MWLRLRSEKPALCEAGGSSEAHERNRFTAGKVLLKDMRSFDSKEVEEMDVPQPPTAALEETLRELETMNRHLGGHRYLCRFLEKRFHFGDTCRVLDMGTGGGDFPRAIVEWSRKSGVHLKVDAVDASEAVIALARKFSVGYPEVKFLLGSALTFSSDHYYDLVHCSLSMHHFTTADAVEVLKRFRELSREYVLVTDLERSIWTRIGVHLVNVLCRHGKMTIQDGDTSARRAFSFREFRVIAKGAGWSDFGHERFFVGRQALWTPKS